MITKQITAAYADEQIKNSIRQLSPKMSKSLGMNCFGC